MSPDLSAHPQRIQVVDSHTGGEPTRVVINGGPNLARNTAAEQLKLFRRHYDPFRSALVNEPRGSEVLVGALLTAPADSSCTTGVIFFNNVGYLGMCGHGAVGVVTTLAHLGKIQPGPHRLDTPVGIVDTQLHPDGSVSIENVPSYRTAKDVAVPVPGRGQVVGEVAWGGNWFFLVENHGQELTLANVDALVGFTWKIRQALLHQGVRGRDNREIDHIELFGPASRPGLNSRNFVLCPGKAYDRSPCGTGTSAKLACLFEDGNLSPGQIWRQESITGSVFEGSIQKRNSHLIPTIKGRAHITAEATLVLDPSDPCRWGIPPS